MAFSATKRLLSKLRLRDKAEPVPPIRKEFSGPYEVKAGEEESCRFGWLERETSVRDSLNPIEPVTCTTGRLTR